MTDKIDREKIIGKKRIPNRMCIWSDADIREARKEAVDLTLAAVLALLDAKIAESKLLIEIDKEQPSKDKKLQNTVLSAHCGEVMILQLLRAEVEGL